jgi:glycosyltransferase involved in cell wall biosynthesis
VPSLLALSEEEREKIVLHVIGKGELYRALEEEVAQHHMEEHCVLHGEVRDVTGLLGQMDAMLLPSRADTVPISIIEGLRAALPVLSTRVGEIPRMIEDCGLLIETTAQSIAQGYREILGDRARFAQYSVNARNRFEQRYTLEQMISQYAAEINKMFEI